MSSIRSFSLFGLYSMEAGYQVWRTKHLPKRKMQKIPGQLQYMPKGAASFLYFCPILLVKTVTNSKGWGKTPLLDGVEQKSICMGENVVANIWKHSLPHMVQFY